MRVVSLLLGLSLAATMAQARPGAPATRLDQIAPESQTVEVNLDLHIQPAILVRFPVPPSADPNQAASELENRYNQILTDNQPLNRFIQPEDVVIYAPIPSAVKPSPRRPHARHVDFVPPKPTSYAIYVLGRRLLSIDAATATASGGASPRLLAIRWARQLQQSLPQLCWRPPGTVGPSHCVRPAADYHHRSYPGRRGCRGTCSFTAEGCSPCTESSRATRRLLTGPRR